MYKAEAISQQTLTTALSTHDSAQAQVDRDQQALNLLKAGSRPEDIAQARSVLKQRQEALNLLKAGSRPEDIAQARAQVMAAQGAMAIVQRNIDDTVIRAPFVGIIARKYADPGAFVAPTTAGSAVTSATSSSILSLASTNEIVAQVAEASIAQIRVGQAATIKLDAYSGKTFTGKVTQVATQSLFRPNVTSFEVKVSVPDRQASSSGDEGCGSLTAIEYSSSTRRCQYCHNRCGHRFKLSSGEKYPATIGIRTYALTKGSCCDFTY